MTVDERRLLLLVAEELERRLEREFIASNGDMFLERRWLGIAGMRNKVKDAKP